jgi:hypothetical protein
VQRRLGEDLSWVHLARAGCLVAAGLLGVIQRCVGGLEQSLGVPAVLRSARDPDAQGDRQGDPRLTQAEGPVPRQLQQTVGHLASRLARRFGQQQDELVAGKADRDPGIPTHFLEQGGHPGQHLVAGVVTLCVVDLLEVIQVDDQQ